MSVNDFDKKIEEYFDKLKVWLETDYENNILRYIGIAETLKLGQLYHLNHLEGIFINNEIKITEDGIIMLSLVSREGAS